MSIVHLLDIDPDLGERLSAAERQRARELIRLRETLAGIIGAQRPTTPTALLADRTGEAHARRTSLLRAA